MHNAIMSELYKIRKNKIFYICIALVFISTIWFVFKNTVVSEAPASCATWLRTAMIVTTVFLSIESGFVITFLFQREYENKTIINVLTAPTSRTIFILSKLAIWFMWYIIALSGSIIIYAIGGRLIYQGGFGINEVKMLFDMIVSSRLLSFVASTPLLLIAVMQRDTFYPTVMCSLAMTGMEIFSLIIPPKSASLIPWSASMLIGNGYAGEYLPRALILIMATGLAGVIGACIFFKRQDQ